METEPNDDFNNNETAINISVVENVSLHGTDAADKNDDREGQLDIRASGGTATVIEEPDHIAYGDVEPITTDATENQTLDSIGAVAVGGSEETFDTECQACLDDGKHIEACSYCVECEEHLCEHCVTMHRKVRLTRGHKLVTIKALNEIAIDRKEPCSIHTDEYVEWFCKTDLSIGCAVCKSTVHNKCNDVIALSKAVSSQKIDETVKNLETAKEAVRPVICKWQIKQKHLAKDRCDSLNKLGVIKKDIETAVNSLHNLVKTDETKIEEKYKEISFGIENDIDKLVQIERSLDNSISTLRRGRVNEEYRLIHIVKAEEKLKIIGETLTDFKNVQSFPEIAYEREQSLDNKLESIHVVGCIDEDKSVYAVARQKEVVIAKDTEKGCDIIDICIVDSKTLLMTDWINTSLKLVDTTVGSVSKFLVPEHRPFGICRVGDENLFAVTLLHGRMVRFFSMSSKGFLPSQIIDTGEKCRDIAYNNTDLFVMCGGGSTYNEGPGHIKVYTSNLKFKKIIIEDGLSHSIINKPFRLRIQPNTDTAFVTDENKILKLNLNTHETNTVIENVPRKGCLCFDPVGRIIFSNYETRSVQLFSRDHKHHMNLLESSDIMQNPRCVAFDAASSTLFIGLEDAKQILCFSLDLKRWEKVPPF